jgi:hypothetical protein
MTFDALAKNIASKIRQEYIKKKTAVKLDQYLHSPRVRLSRLYGYAVRDNGKAERVPEEAAIIRKVFDLFAAGKRVEEIKKTMDKIDARTRFGNLWNAAGLMGLIRCTYAGLVQRKLGGYVRSDIYPPIIAPQVYDLAKKALKKQIEEAQIDPVEAVLGVVTRSSMRRT